MSSRFNSQRADARSSLFSAYDQTRSRPSSTGPNAYSRPAATNGGYTDSSNQVFGAYPSKSRPSTGSPYTGGSYGVGGGSEDGRKSAQDMRANFEKKGYNTAMLDELESQNDEQVSEMAKRVGMLKDVSWTFRYSFSTTGSAGSTAVDTQWNDGLFLDLADRT